MNAASEVLKELGIEDVFMLGLAERFEEVYVEGGRINFHSRDSRGSISCSTCGMKPIGLP